MGKIILSHNFYEYKQKRARMNYGQNNGAFMYSQEIVKNIAPRVKTQRPWATIRIDELMEDHVIFFVHTNIRHEEKLGWLRKYKDLVLVTSAKITEEWCRENLPDSHTIFVPLSIDTKYVRQFATEKTKEVCYAGNAWNFQREDMARNISGSADIYSQLDHEDLLRSIAPYKKCYAIGRTAIEARVLGCEILPFDSRYPDPSIWQVLDNADAAKILQKELDKIDKIGA